MARSQQELDFIFGMVCDADDWRAPIAAWCWGREILGVCEAIRHFTATEPTLQFNPNTRRYLVTADGYRNGPAGP